MEDSKKRKSTIMETVGNLLLICSVFGFISAYASLRQEDLMGAVSWFISCLLTAGIGSLLRHLSGKAGKKKQEQEQKKEDSLMAQFKTLEKRNRNRKH